MEWGRIESVGCSGIKKVRLKSWDEVGLKGWDEVGSKE